MIDYELYTLIAVICYTFLELEFAWYFDFVELFNDTLQKPLGKCVQCFTGQVALWTFVLIKLIRWGTHHPTPYDLIELFMSIFYAIFVSLMIQKFTTWLEK